MSNLKTYLKEKGIRQEDAAKDLNLSQGRVSQICNSTAKDGGVSLETARRLFVWSNGEVNYLLPPEGGVADDLEVTHE